MFLYIHKYASKNSNYYSLWHICKSDEVITYVTMGYKIENNFYVCNECKIKFPTILGLGFNISKCSDYYIYDKNNFSYQFNKIFEKAIDI